MSRYFRVLERAARSNELVPAVSGTVPYSAEMRRPRSLDGLVREEIAKLVQRVFLLSNGAAPHAVVFSGLEHSEASSRICARAGQTLAKQGTSAVCLVDANLRLPRLHTHFGVENRRGLVDALFQTGSIRDLAQPLTGANLWIVPSGGTATPDVHTRLGGEFMQRCLAELRVQFNYVLIDTSPADLYADAAVVGKLVDGVVLVVEANSTRRETAKQAKESLETANVKILGAVLDKRTFPIPEALYRRL